MKASKALLLIGASVMFVLSSCTLEKRKFQQGYHLEWKTNLKEIAQSESEGLKKKVITPKADTRQTPEEKSISKSPEPNQEEAVVSASTAPLPIAPKKWYA